MPKGELSVFCDKMSASPKRRWYADDEMFQALSITAITTAWDFELVQMIFRELEKYAFDCNKQIQFLI